MKISSQPDHQPTDRREVDESLLFNEVDPDGRVLTPAEVYADTDQILARRRLNVWGQEYR